MSTARHAAPRPTPRWARVGAVLVIAWTAVVAPWAVVHTAHDVAVRDGLSAPSISAPAPQTAACGSDAECARYDQARGIFPAPDVTQAPDAMCPAGWMVVGIDDDTVPAACIPAPLDAGR